MKRLIGNSVIGLAVVWGISLSLGGCGAYLISTERDGVTYDLFGREYINPAPVLARIFFGQDRFGPWFGWGWWAFDMIAFWGSIFCIAKLVQFAHDLKDEP